MTFPVIPRAALSMLALAVASPFSAAQTSAENLLSAAAVVVTATRSPQAAVDVLSDNAVITADEIERSGAVSIIDLLQRQRGIEVARNGGPGTSSSVFIRGGDSKQNIVLVDGVRIGSSTTGAANWTALPLTNIDRIEIVYGPLATLYGADAIGGVVQIFTKRGAGAPHVTVALGAGGDVTRTAEAGVFGASGGEHSVHYAFGAANEHAAGFSSTRPGSSSFNRDNDGYDKKSATGQVGIDLAKGHELGLLFLQSRVNSQYDSGASSYDARLRQELDNVALFSKNRVTPGWSSNFQVAQADDRSASDASAAPSGKSSISTRQSDVSWQNDLVLGPDLLQLLLERRTEKVNSSAAATLNKERTTNSAAASYLLKRGAHLATASVRNDDSSQYGSKTTGGIGYGYKVSRALRVNASAGTSFRAPTFNELYFAGFGIASNKPEHGRNREAGIYFDDGRSQLSAVAYRNVITDLLVNAPKCPVEASTHPLGCAYNVNRALLTGLSVGARSRLGDFNVRASLDLQDPRDDTTGKMLARRAKRHANAAVEYAVGSLVTGAELHVSGRRFDDLANKNALGGYGLLDLFASYEFARDWTALVRWTNATDKRYELARNYATAGAKVFAGVRYGLK